MDRNIKIAKQLVKIAKSLIAGKGSNYAHPKTYDYTNLVIGDCAGYVMIFYGSQKNEGLDYYFDYDEESIKNSEVYKDGWIDDEDVECALNADGYSEFECTFGNYGNVLEFEDSGFKLKPGFSHKKVSGNGYEFDVVYERKNKPDEEWFQELPENFDTRIQ